MNADILFRNFQFATVVQCLANGQWHWTSIATASDVYPAISGGCLCVSVWDTCQGHPAEHEPDSSGSSLQLGSQSGNKHATRAVKVSRCFIFLAQTLWKHSSDCCGLDNINYDVLDIIILLQTNLCLWYYKALHFSTRKNIIL